jgi:hypothetical protein
VGKYAGPVMGLPAIGQWIALSLQQVPVEAYNTVQHKTASFCRQPYTYFGHLSVYSDTRKRERKDIRVSHTNSTRLIHTPKEIRFYTKHANGHRKVREIEEREKEIEEKRNYNKRWRR